MSERSTTTEFVESVRFSEEQRAELGNRGFMIFELKGESIASLKAAGIPFWSIWHDGKETEQVQSRFGEVAIHPEHLFLPNSGAENVTNQLRLTEEYGQKISKEIPGIQAVIGSAADYLELEHSYKEKTGRSLVRYAGRDDRIITSTSISDSVNLFVGELFDGRLVASYRFGTAYSDIKVLPLITSKH